MRARGECRSRSSSRQAAHSHCLAQTPQDGSGSGLIAFPGTALFTAHPDGRDTEPVLSTVPRLLKTASVARLIVPLLKSVVPLLTLSAELVTLKVPVLLMLPVVIVNDAPLVTFTVPPL